MTFELHPRLAAGGFDLGTRDGCRVLLKNNALYPWFILVPEVDAGIVDLHQLDDARYLAVCGAVRRTSAFVSQHFDVEKVNVGAIGNVVSQLHVHVVGRRSTDPSWPGVVWGHPDKAPYTPARVEELRRAYLDATSA